MTLIIAQEKSPNCGPRKNEAGVAFLILHCTEIDARETHDKFMTTGTDVSAHYVVAKDGKITQYVHEHTRAWHAGVSYWGGVTDINSASIGIEIVNGGAPAGYPPYSDIQMEAVIALCRDILRRHPKISPYRVLGHSDVAPDRKTDPGPAFDWEVLERNGVGVLPKDDTGTVPDAATLDVHLAKIGYNPAVDLDVRLRAFAAHYDRKNWSLSGKISPETLRKVRVFATI